MAASKNTAQLASYVDPALKRRVERVVERKPRLTMSRVVEECVEKALPAIERRVGITNGKGKAA